MKIEFVHDGGFGKTGGFVEYVDSKMGNEPVYQRQGYLGVDIKCRDVSVRHNFISQKDENAGTRRSIVAVGDLGDADWGAWRLSMLGSNRDHDTVSVMIHEVTSIDAEYFSAGGIAASDKQDIDAKWDERFYVQVGISSKQFSLLLDQINKPPFDLHLYVNFDAFPYFITTWSPSISEGRLIKFLNSEKDVENPNDIPQDFFKNLGGFFLRRSGDLNPDDKAPVSLWTSKKHETVHTMPQTDVDDWNKEYDDEEAIAVATVERSSTQSDMVALAITDLGERIAKSASQIRFWLILLTVSVLLVGLTR